jgi:hypothetical protein
MSSNAVITIRSSSLDQMDPCKRRFYYMNFRRDIPGIGHPRAVLGTAVHAGIARFWSDRQVGRAFESGRYTEAALQALEQERKKRPVDGMDYAQTWTRAAFLASWYGITHARSTEHPVAVEMEIAKVPVPGIVLTGHPDLVLRDASASGAELVPVDHKVKKKAMSQGQADKLMQLTAYAYFMGLGWLTRRNGRLVDRMNCRVDNLVIGGLDTVNGDGVAGQPALKEIPTERTLDDLAKMNAVLTDIRDRGKDPENYPARPTHLCKACGYRAVCAAGQRFLQQKQIPMYEDFEGLAA